MAMTGAERARRFRQRRKKGRKSVHYKRPAEKKLSRADRWCKAVAELLMLQEECQRWLDAMPKGLHGTVKHERLVEVCEVDLSEVEAAEPPRGWGRD